jgi:hypothetical protein
MSTQTSTFPPEEAKRVNYRDGILLAASDFQQEQLYHRGRLASVLSRLIGFGTVAGLKVEQFPVGSIRPEEGQPRTEEEIVVNPGLALDRVGRLIEVRKKYCLRLQKWFDHETQTADASLTPLVDDTNRYLVADIFLKFVECPQGLRPSFPEPAADATDAVTPARTQEGFELNLVVRDCDPETDQPPLPEARFSAKPANYRALLDKIYASYADAPGQPPEYPDDFDTTAVFLSRVLVRLADAPATDLTRHASNEIAIEDDRRPLAVPSDLLATLLPQPES